MKFKTLILFVIVLFATSLYGQEDSADAIPNERNKNNIYASAGSLWLYGMAANLNYERLITERESGLMKSYWIRTGTGLYWSWEKGGEMNFLSGITALSGSRNSHLEVLLGLSFHSPLNNLDRLYLMPAGAMGYRFQKPNGLLIFRLGLGFPENAYFSFGLSF